MNYVTHTRAAFARLAAEPAATPQHVSLYVALFQQWNAAYFRPSLILVRDELMEAAHLGNRNTYLACLRDLTTWGFITYQPSRSQHRPSRALMHELGEADLDKEEGDESPATWSTSGPSDGPTRVQAVGPIPKTSANQANEANEVNAALAGTKKIDFVSSSAACSEKAYSSLNPRNDAKEKVAPKRKVRSHTPAPARPIKRPEVPFAESELADLGSFIAAFTGTDFELANLRYYHEKVATWRKDGEPPRRRDWKATAKTFMLNDVERNALVLAPGTHRGSAGATPHPPHPADHAAEYVSQRYA